MRVLLKERGNHVAAMVSHIYFYEEESKLFLSTGMADYTIQMERHTANAYIRELFDREFLDFTMWEAEYKDHE